MAATLKEIEGRFLAVIPVESTVDRVLHAHAVALVVFEARRQAVEDTRRLVASAQAHVEKTDELVRLLKERVREGGP